MAPLELSEWWLKVMLQVVVSAKIDILTTLGVFYALGEHLQYRHHSWQSSFCHMFIVQAKGVFASCEAMSMPQH